MDATTGEVLGIPEICRSVGVRWSRSRALVSNPRTFVPSDGEPWDEEVRHLRAVEAWLESADMVAVTTAFEQLPDMLRPVATLESAEPLDEVGLFELKRFLFWARAIVVHASDLAFVDDTWAERLADAMRTLHPEKQPSARFHLSAELEPRLSKARDEVRRLRKQLKQIRDAIEASIVDAHGGRFDVRGRYRPAQGGEVEDPRLRPEGAAWRIVDPELARVEQEIEAANQRMWAIEAALMAKLTDALRPEVRWLADLCEALAALDVRIAKAELRVRWGGVWGDWCRDRTAIEDGRLPRLLHVVVEEDIQPITVDVSRCPVVLTGPNMGGKSALLELVGVAQWCAQHAFPVPATRFVFRPVTQVVYVGAEEPFSAGATGLSAFGREVRRLVDFWQGVPPRLWLLDELGRGTHPEEGASIATHVIRARHAAGDYVLAATHFPAVASMAQATHLRIAGLDPERTRAALSKASQDLGDIEAVLRSAMDYRPVPTDATEDAVPRDAWLIARLLGFDVDEP